MKRLAYLIKGPSTLLQMKRKKDFELSGFEQKELSEDKILLRLYQSAADLKDEIGRRIVQRGKANWDLVNLQSKGSFLYLIFRHKLTN